MNEVAFLVGEAVAEIRYDNRIVFVAGEKPEPTLYADVGGEYVVMDAAGQPHPLASLVGRTVSAASTADDELTIDFDDGFSLRCPPDPNFEAWQIVGGSPQYLVVCQPGGELAVWDERHVPSREEADKTVERVFGEGWRVREISERGGISVEREPTNDD